MSEKSGCSRATSPPTAGCSARGRPLPISENDVLFQLIGTTYGGDGEETFNLPNLASRVPIHMGTGPDGTTYQLGEMAGTEQETLTVQQIPNHTHPFDRLEHAGASRTTRRATMFAQARRRSSTPSMSPIAPDRTQVDRRRPAAASRTRTRSRSSASTSSSRSSGCSPARPKEERMSDPVRSRNPHLPLQLPPDGLGLLQRAVDAPLAEHGALLAARHHLRRRRQVHLRAARPAGQRAHAARPGSGALAARPRRDVRRRDASRCSSRRYRSTRTPISATEEAAQREQPRRITLPARRRRAVLPRRPPSTPMAFQALSPAGGGLPHNNMQPYLTLNFCIALQGIFPQRP